MFFGKRAQPVNHPPLRGVNLGGWLVLEKWITPSIFGDLSATDEYTLCSKANPALQQNLRRHRDTFITKADFEWLASHGIEAVRLPVGYWTFGDEPPYSSTIEYVDKAFKWAKQTGIYILLDLHAAPGSQNGKDHSGRMGKADWPADEKNVIKTLEVLSKLAKRYAKHPKLLGFELLNEPTHTLPTHTLMRYYKAAYRMVRKECGPNIWVAFSDGFRPKRWKRKLRGNGYTNVVMDTHQYQSFSPRDRKLDMAGHMEKTSKQVPKELAAMRAWHPIIVGEWSLALDGQSLKHVAAWDLDAAHRAYGAAQLLAYSQSSAWFYWTYRTEKGGTWSFRDCVERGLLPDFSVNFIRR